MNLVGYSQGDKLGKLTISKIQKESKKIDYLNQNKIVDIITETKEDSVYGKIVSFYTIYANEEGVVDKILIEHTTKGIKKMMTEEIYIKNKQVIYYKGYDYSSANSLEVYFVDYVELKLKVNNKFVNPVSEDVLLVHDYIGTLIQLIKSKHH
jgi:hypothetical protein